MRTGELRLALQFLEESFEPRGLPAHGHAAHTAQRLQHHSAQIASGSKRVRQAAKKAAKKAAKAAKAAGGEDDSEEKEVSKEEKKAAKKAAKKKAAKKKHLKSQPSQKSPEQKTAPETSNSSGQDLGQADTIAPDSVDYISQHDDPHHHDYEHDDHDSYHAHHDEHYHHGHEEHQDTDHTEPALSAPLPVPRSGGPDGDDTMPELDENGDGMISKMECRKMLKKLGLMGEAEGQHTGKEVDSLFDDLDLDHGGELDFDELDRALKKL